jgi:tRNA modification GTPase
MDEFDLKNLELIRGKKSIVVKNKCDLETHLILPADIGFPVVDVSCLTGEGIEKLKDVIYEVVFKGKPVIDAGGAIINLRHKEALIRAREALKHTKESLIKGESLEFAAVDLRIAVNAIGEITGKTATEDLLDVIFSQFCIGK